jgi:hypothetical protein
MMPKLSDISLTTSLQLPIPRHQAQSVPKWIGIVCILRPDHSGKLKPNRRTVLLPLAAPLVSLIGSCDPVAAGGELLPQSYQQNARDLIGTLRDSIYGDLDGLPEREVRRRADPAKDLVKQILTRWGNSKLINDDPSYTQLVAAIQELGEFYKANGQRARIDAAIAESILAKLDAAEAALPPAPEKKSLLPF